MWWQARAGLTGWYMYLYRDRGTTRLGADPGYGLGGQVERQRIEAPMVYRVGFRVGVFPSHMERGLGKGQCPLPRICFF